MGRKRNLLRHQLYPPRPPKLLQNSSQPRPNLASPRPPRRPRAKHLRQMASNQWQPGKGQVSSWPLTASHLRNWLKLALWWPTNRVHVASGVFSAPRTAGTLSSTVCLANIKCCYKVLSASTCPRTTGCAWWHPMRRRNRTCSVRSGASLKCMCATC